MKQSLNEIKRLQKLAGILNEDTDPQSAYNIGDIISSLYGRLHYIGIVTDIKKSKVIINKFNNRIEYPSVDGGKKQLVYIPSNELVPITRSRISSVGLSTNPHYDYLVVDDKGTPMEDFTRDQIAKYKELN